jgi:outer membrane lipoprotein carrier protein
MLSGGLVVAAVLFSTTVIPAQQSLPSAHELSQRVDRRYDQLQSLKAGFSESYAGLGMTRPKAAPFSCVSRAA